MPTSVLREEAIGFFGEIRVCDDDCTRSFWVDALCQGSNYLEESIPGPIPESSYVFAWLAAAAGLREPRICMIGLGAGSGAVLLAAHGYRVTVIECDCIVVDVARRQYPLLGHYEALGMITVIVGDALPHLGQAWDLVLCDAYTDSSQGICPDAWITTLRQHTYRVAVNVVDGSSLRWSTPLRERWCAAGWSAAQSLLTYHAESDAVTPTGNAILIAGAPLAPTWRSAPVFSERGDLRAELARSSYAGIRLHTWE